MSNAHAATAFQRTDAGADELTQPKLGLSLPQRKMLRCCGTSTSIGEIERLFAAEEAHYSRERFDRDLEKLEQFGLIQRTGAALKIVHTKPSAATIALPPQVKASAPRPPELRRVSTAQAQPQRIVHALVGIGAMALTGTAFWLWHGHVNQDTVHAPIADNTQHQQSAPIFIDEPAAVAEAPRATPMPHAKTEANARNNVRAPAQPAQPKAKTPPQPATYTTASKPAPQPAVAKPAPVTVESTAAAKPSAPQAIASEPAPTTKAIANPAPVAAAPVATRAASLPALTQPAPVAAAAAPVMPAAPPTPAVAVPARTVVEVAAATPKMEAEAAPVAKAEKKAGLKLAYREKADFPPEALLADIHKGSVRAKLAIDEAGNVTDVTIVSAQGGRLFSRPAIAALKKWRYEPTGQRENTTAEIEFRE